MVEVLFVGALIFWLGTWCFLLVISRYDVYMSYNTIHKLQVSLRWGKIFTYATFLAYILHLSILK